MLHCLIGEGFLTGRGGVVRTPVVATAMPGARGRLGDVRGRPPAAGVAVGPRRVVSRRDGVPLHGRRPAAALRDVVLGGQRGVASRRRTGESAGVHGLRLLGAGVDARLTDHGGVGDMWPGRRRGLWELAAASPRGAGARRREDWTPTYGTTALHEN